MALYGGGRETVNDIISSLGMVGSKGYNGLIRLSTQKPGILVTVSGYAEKPNTPALRLEIYSLIFTTMENEFYQRSNCCGAPVTVDGDDDEGMGGTRFYRCTACDNPCDIGGIEDRISQAPPLTEMFF